MNAMHPDPLVRDYLGRLDAAAWPLSADRRAELATEVRDHIEAALAEEGRRDEVAVRNILERLGSPQDIVAAEASRQPGGAPIIVNVASPPAGTWGPLEVAAVLLLTVGAVVLPVFGPLIGLLLVWMSPRLGRREKAIGTLIFVLLVVLPILGLIAVVPGGSAPVSGWMRLA